MDANGREIVVPLLTRFRVSQNELHEKYPTMAEAYRVAALNGLNRLF